MNSGKKFTVKEFFFRFLSRHVILTILLGIAVLMTALSGLLPSYALRYLIDGYITPVMDSGTEVETGRLLGVTAIYFASYVLVGLSTFLENLMIDTFGQKMIHELRYEMIRKSHYLRSSFFTESGTGTMTSRVTDDVYAIETLFASGLIELVVNLFKIIGILVSVFVFSYLLGLILLCVIPIIYLITHAFRKVMLKNHMKNRLVMNQQSNHVTETIDNHRTIRNLDKEEYRENQFRGILMEFFHASNKTAIFDSVYSPIVQFLKALLIAIVTFCVGYGKDHSDFLSLGISIGTFAAAINLISSVFSPIEQIGQELETMQEAVSGIKRVESFMNEPEIKKRNPEFTVEKILAEKDKTLLSFSHLTFHYDDGDENIYSDASFEIQKKEKLTIIGRTGAGKTTLFRLILGILEPTDGVIEINGYDVSQIPDEEKKKLFGYVEQGFKAIPGSVMDQITLRDKSISMNQVHQAMEEVGLDSYVRDNLKDGYQTPFRYEDFSRGQLQLLSLARAMVSNPSVLLLDEISANLDSETEQKIIHVLADASKDRTVISISHRISDQLGFERTIEICDGKAVEKK